jgi:DNA polymerase-1
MDQNDFLLIIDGSSLLTTNFFGNLPRQIMFAKTLEEKERYFDKIMQTSDGIYTNAVYGFMRFLIKVLEEQKPKYLAVSWDLSRNTFRKEMYADYKANRTETLSPLKDQFMICQYVLDKCGIAQFLDLRYEADDFCGSLAAKFESKLPVYILTKDNDYLQLINDKTKLWLMHSSQDKTDELYKKYGIDKKKVNAPDRCFVYDTKLVKEEFGIEAENVNSYKGIAGDTSDNIKGVTGVGEKTATALIAYYHTVDKVYEDIDSKSEAELKSFYKESLGLSRSPYKYLLEGRDDAFLSEKLATIKKDIDLDISLNDLSSAINADNLKKVLAALEFNSVNADTDKFETDNSKQLPDYKYGYNYAFTSGVFTEGSIALADSIESRLPAKAEDTSLKLKSYELKEISDFGEADELFDRLLKEKHEKIGFFFEEEAGDISALNICVSEELIYRFPVFMFLSGDYLAGKVKQLIENKKNCNFVTFELKKAYRYIGCDTKNNLNSVTLAAYLCDPADKEYDIASIAKTYLPVNEVSEDKAGYFAFLLWDILSEKLKESEMMSLYKDIELPLIQVLFEMEKRGIAADREHIAEYGSKLLIRINELTKEIYDLAGEEFNINSPKQLGVILFEKMGLPSGKKTKSGYSTSADVLEKLSEDYDIVKKILEYRQYSKLKSTYADGLYDFIKEDGRIHCSFNQTVTATGRLSCTDPNLQNIPIRTELGRLIRKNFVPKEGCVFLDADYSQIELRVLAHLSKDKTLIDAFLSGADIHQTTASKVFNVPFDEVTKDQRRSAKAVNFGIVYGISAFGLSEDIGISRSEASKFIDKYFETYKDVKKYVDSLVEGAKDKGYVSTLYGRRRYIKELDSPNFNIRQFGERVAMNTPVQGTAADIIKISMINVNNRLKAETKGSRLLLQIHDELLIEAPEYEKELAAKILKEEMENAAHLAVPLLVEVNEGKDWYEAK